MHVNRPRLPLFLIAILSMVASCDMETRAKSDGPATTQTVEPHNLAVHWCPTEQQIYWMLDFGLSSDQARSDDPVPWPGGSFYIMTGAEAGLSGGRSGLICGPNACTFDPEQQQAKRWRIGETVDANFLPSAMEVEVRPVQGYQPHLFRFDNPVFRARFEFAKPGQNDATDCLTVPVRSVSLRITDTKKKSGKQTQR